MSEIFHVKRDLPKAKQVELARRWLYGKDGKNNRVWICAMANMESLVNNTKNACGMDWHDVELLLKVAIGDLVENREEDEVIKQSINRGV